MSFKYCIYQITLPELEFEFEFGETELQLLEFRSEFISVVESQFGAIRPDTRPPKPCGVVFGGRTPAVGQKLDIGVLALQFVLLKLFSEFASSICSKSFLHSSVSSLSMVKCSPCSNRLEHASQRKQFKWNILLFIFITKSDLVTFCLHLQHLLLLYSLMVIVCDKWAPKSGKLYANCQSHV